MAGGADRDMKPHGDHGVVVVSDTASAAADTPENRMRKVVARDRRDVPPFVVLAPRRCETGVARILDGRGCASRSVMGPIPP